MKNIIFTLAFLFSISPCFAGSITPKNPSVTEKEKIGNLHIASPTDIAEIQRVNNYNIHKMIDTKSLKELATYAKKLNRAEINAALKNGTPPPPVLSDEILQSKEKITQYLKSMYTYNY